LRRIAAQVLDPTRPFPAGLGGLLDTHHGCSEQVRNGCVWRNWTGLKPNGAVRVSDSGRFWTVSMSMRESDHIRPRRDKPVLWTQSASARRHFATETLGKMALASTNFSLVGWCAILSTVRRVPSNWSFCRPTRRSLTRSNISGLTGSTTSLPTSVRRTLPNSALMPEPNFDAHASQGDRRRVLEAS
jgi:hypothetical protein